jgi:zinc protease
MTRVGVHSIAPDELTAWAARYFTRGNPALWVAGERIPPSLSLRLPDGERQPIPASTPVISTPAYVPSPDGRIAFNAVVPRTATAQIFTDVLERELLRSLRHDIGLSYSASAEYVPRDAESSVVTALVNAFPDDRDAVLGAFIDTVARLRLGTFSGGGPLS